MLLLNMQHDGHGPALVSLVKMNVGMGMEVHVTQAVVEDSLSTTHLGPLHAGEASSPQTPVASKRPARDQHGHVEALRHIALRPGQSDAAAVSETSTVSLVRAGSVSIAKPLSKLAALRKFCGIAFGANSAKDSKAADGRETPSYQLDELDFETNAADWSNDAREAICETLEKKDAHKVVGDEFKPKDDAPQAKDAQAAGPGFVLPPRKTKIGQAYDRSKPGFTAIESVGIRPFGNLFNAAAAGSYDPDKTALLSVGVGVGAIQDALAGGLNAHALVASIQKGKRYRKQLEKMLQKDVDQFKKSPQLATLILTKDEKGNWSYDMEKVMTLATSDRREQQEASAHAKNVFLTAFIADEVARKRRNRATYEVTRNVISLASAGAIVGGTLGMAAPAAIGAKGAGLGLGFANALDGAKGVRGLKQRMRDDKEREIEVRFLAKRMDLRNVAYDKSLPQQAINGAQAAIKDTVRQEANQVIFRYLIAGQHINEKKSSEAKKGRAELAAKHALDIINYQVDIFARIDGALEDFHRHVSGPGLPQWQRRRRLAASVKNDPPLRLAYDLMRDVGMRGSEATLMIQKLVMLRIEKKLAENPECAGAAIEVAQKYVGNSEARDVSYMRTVLGRH